MGILSDDMSHLGEESVPSLPLITKSHAIHHHIVLSCRLNGGVG